MVSIGAWIMDHWGLGCGCPDPQGGRAEGQWVTVTEVSQEIFLFIQLLTNPMGSLDYVYHLFNLPTDTSHVLVSGHYE